MPTGKARKTMAQQQTVLVLNDGEKLTILIARDGRDIGDIASAWGKTRVQVWRYQNSEKLKPVVIKKACEVLGVPESIFDARLNPDTLLNELDRMRTDIEMLKDSKASQESVNKALIARIQTLEEENSKLRILQN